MAINQFENLSIFLLFSKQPNRVFFFFFFDFLIKIIAIKLISPNPSIRYYYIQIFTLFPIQTLRLGIFSISLDFVVLKAYFWSICFCLDSNFVHTLLFALSILNFCGFCSWIWNAMSKLNLWFCVLRAFNVIVGAFALVFQLNEWSRRVQNSLSVGLKARTSVGE